MYTLIIENSDGEQVAFPLLCEIGTNFRIGRSDECEISLPDERHLSRVHCFLTATDEGFVLTDNNSSNGIYEDDARTPQIFMQPAKVYRIGSCMIRIEGQPEVHAEEEVYAQPEAVEEPLAVVEDPAEELPSPQADESWSAAELPVAVADDEAYEEEPAGAPEDIPAVAPMATPPVEKKRRVRFQAPPPRKAIVKRPPPRAFYTAGGTLNTEVVLQKPKQLKHRAAVQGTKVQREPSVSAEEFGLPYDFAVEAQLLNTTAVLLEGDLLRFGIYAEEDCHVFIIQYDSENNAAMLVPGVGGASNKLFAGQRVQFPPPGNKSGYELYVEPPYGEDIILVIACTASCKFDKIWADCYQQSDEWRKIGEVESKAIQFCKEIKGAESALWAAAVLKVRTGE